MKRKRCAHRAQCAAQRRQACVATAALAARLLARALVRACASRLTACTTAPRGRCMLIRWQRRRRRCAPPRRALSAAFKACVFGGSARPARLCALTLTHPAPRLQAKAAAGEEDAGAAYAPRLAAHTTCVPLSPVRRSSSLAARDAQARGAGGGCRARHAAAGAREAHHPPGPGREANAARRRAPHFARNRACPATA